MSLFKRKPQPVQTDLPDPREHEMREIVIVSLPNRLESDTASLEATLTAVCERTHLGFSGSTEQEDTEVSLYFYCPEAHPLFAALQPALLAHPDAADARIVLATGFRASRRYTEFPLHANQASPDHAAATRSTP